MGRIFILVTLLLINSKSFSQNLLLNGDFEEVISKVGDYHLSVDSFYAKKWTIPTDCTPDIYRDTSACDDKHIKNYEPQMSNCINVQSGKYCVGLGLLSFYGSIEHITGELNQKLEKDKVYKIAFYLRFLGGDSTYVSKGFGYKLSPVPIPFNSSIMEINKLAPYYQTLFKENKVYADYQLDNEFTSTEWVKIESFYKARGGEKYITFGLFSFNNDGKIISQFEKLNKHPMFIGSQKFLTQVKSLVVRSYFGRRNSNNFPHLDNYYFLDNISVEPLSTSNSKIANLTCNNCIDNNPSTIFISRQMNFLIDRGYHGDMTFTVSAAIRKNEKITISLDKTNKIIIVGDTSAITNVNYQFTYPAGKITNKNVTYTISGLEDAEKTELINDWIQLPDAVTNFKGKVYTNIAKLTTTDNKKEIEISPELLTGDVNYPISYLIISGQWRSFGGFLLWK